MPAEPVTLLSTRLSEEVHEILRAAVRETGMTQRAAVEHAIRAAYGPDADEWAGFEAAQRVYIEAVEMLLAQVEGPDKAKDVTAAFDRCVKAHNALMEAWPSEREES